MCIQKTRDNEENVNHTVQNQPVPDGDDDDDMQEVVIEVNDDVDGLSVFIVLSNDQNVTNVNVETIDIFENDSDLSSYGDSSSISLDIPGLPTPTTHAVQVDEPINFFASTQLTVPNEGSAPKSVSEHGQRVSSARRKDSTQETNRFLSRNIGKKRARRLENARALEVLAGCEEYEEEPLFGDVFRFSQVVQDTNIAKKILNAAMDDIDNEMTKQYSKRMRNGKNIQESNDGGPVTGEGAFSKLTTAEKNFFKQRNIPLGIVRHLEDVVFSFFKENPSGIYTSDPLSSFERMILHGVAHYFMLHSFSFTRKEDSARLTKVNNSANQFCSQQMLLTEYLEKIKFGKHSRHRSHFASVRA